mmetsp:Transcript_13361/g.19489  ORF Transcript_13361/g.19489 Transcript_13361/m.19489 type:complete len:193 (-) Transcript_13361:1026-1604(-)
MAGPAFTPEGYKKLVAAFLAFTVIVGYMTATQPSGAGWRFFSWHPFLMVTGFVGMMGTSAVTKKLGGYSNTKLHGILASLGLMMAFGGLYVIYRNKEIMGKEHITSTHALAGIITMAGALMASLAGGIFLHPDFGFDKTNKTIRFGHKWFSRTIILSAWITCVLGLQQMTSDKFILATFILPLVILAPFSLI